VIFFKIVKDLLLLSYLTFMRPCRIDNFISVIGDYIVLICILKLIFLSKLSVFANEQLMSIKRATTEVELAPFWHIISN